MTDPQKDEHIEELLSKLQGIFGKLSSAEEEESAQKVDVPARPPVQPPKPAAAEKPPVFAPPPAAPMPAAPVENPPPPLTPVIPVSTGNATAGGYDSISPVSDPEKMIVPTAVYYPTGKEAEAKSLCMKLEMMTPKFTKVAFRLRVVMFSPYDPKSDWKDAVLKQTTESGCQTMFVVVDRLLDDTRKKTISAECEAKNIYFQDVPMGSIEKKAHYTDILLGLVFFFDSHRPPATEESA